MHPDCDHLGSEKHFCAKCAAVRDTENHPWRASTAEEKVSNIILQHLAENFAEIAKDVQFRGSNPITIEMNDGLNEYEIVISRKNP